MLIAAQLVCVIIIIFFKSCALNSSIKRDFPLFFLLLPYCCYPSSCEWWNRRWLSCCLAISTPAGVTTSNRKYRNGSSHIFFMSPPISESTCTYNRKIRKKRGPIRQLCVFRITSSDAHQGLPFVYNKKQQHAQHTHKNNQTINGNMTWIIHQTRVTYYKKKNKKYPQRIRHTHTDRIKRKQKKNNTFNSFFSFLYLKKKEPFEKKCLFNRENLCVD